jgi:two-component sensor histidine kinase
VDGFHKQTLTEDTLAAEYRIVRSEGTIRWMSGRGQVVSRDESGRPLRQVNVVMDITDRKQAEHHIELLMGEISHRSKNLLSVVQAIAAQTVRTAGTIEEFQKRFSQRLQGLATSHDLLVHKNWQGASLADLVRDQLAPFVDGASTQLRLSGAETFVSPRAAEAIGLALHELATNAVKYGALSIQTGHVEVSWAPEKSADVPSMRLSWVERGGPAITAPASKGFGHVVFERIVAHSLNGKVVTDFAPQGLQWDFWFPLSHVVNR